MLSTCVMTKFWPSSKRKERKCPTHFTHKPEKVKTSHRSYSQRLSTKCGWRCITWTGLGVFQSPGLVSNKHLPPDAQSLSFPSLLQKNNLAPAAPSPWESNENVDQQCMSCPTIKPLETLLFKTGLWSPYHKYSQGQVARGGGNGVNK